MLQFALLAMKSIWLMASSAWPLRNQQIRMTVWKIIFQAFILHSRSKHFFIHLTQKVTGFYISIHWLVTRKMSSRWRYWTTTLYGNRVRSVRPDHFMNWVNGEHNPPQWPWTQMAIYYSAWLRQSPLAAGTPLHHIAMTICASSPIMMKHCNSPAAWKLNEIVVELKYCGCWAVAFRWANLHFSLVYSIHQFVQSPFRNFSPALWIQTN